MKKILMILVVVLLLSACSGNKLISNKKPKVVEMEDYFFTWARADSHDEALFQCKKQVVEAYYPEVLNGDLTQDWMAIMTSVFSEEIVDSFIIEDTGKYYVSIKIFKAKNKHLIKRE